MEGSFSPTETEHNLVGYSYGSVVAAQAALRLGAEGTRIDNLVLIGSPINPKSELAQALETSENIGRVIWVDIPGDSFSAGIDVTEILEMKRHFAFIGEPATGKPTPHQLELAAFVAGAMVSVEENIRVSLPTSLESR